MVMINEFLEKGDERVLVISLTPQGQLCPATTFPASSKTKVCDVCVCCCVCACVYVHVHTCTLVCEEVTTTYM